MTISRHSIKIPQGEVEIYTLVNAKGSSVEVSSLGAGIISVVVPDSLGNMADVALGYADTAEYVCDPPCMGKTPGRYANRIGYGRFSLDGKDYILETNCGPHALHGGPMGFHNKIWKSEQLSDSVRFTYTSIDGEEGYPGELKVTVEYHWSDMDELTVKFSAVTDTPTVVNLTNHTYWNLRGEDSGSVLAHKLQLKCSRYIAADSTLLPTGEYADVVGTPMNFLTPKELGSELLADFPAVRAAKGYDSSWAIDDWNKGEFIPAVVTLEDPESGRVLEVGTTQPAAHIYTGNWLAGSAKSKSGRSYNDYDGVAIECQGMPDAPNRSEFPSQVLRPGEEYSEVVRFSFKVKS